MRSSEGLVLAGARIGCVPYLNARPLLEGLTLPVTELVPSRLFDAFQEGMFDAALLSSKDVISMPSPEAVDGISIASHGDVYSVILTYSGELEAIERIQLDPASHSSNALLQIILEEFYGLNPEYVQIPEEMYEPDPLHLPALLIGDRAIVFRNLRSSPDVRILDLGGAWYQHTGLPFVFALWALKNEFTEKSLLSDILRNAKKVGLAKRQEIASKTMNPHFSMRYFTEFIRYDLGEKEKQGLALFQHYLTLYKLVPIDEKNHELLSYF